MSQFLTPDEHAARIHQVADIVRRHALAAINVEVPRERDASPSVLLAVDVMPPGVTNLVTNEWKSDDTASATTPRRFRFLTARLEGMLVQAIEYDPPLDILPDPAADMELF